MRIGLSLELYTRLFCGHIYSCALQKTQSTHQKNEYRALFFQNDVEGSIVDIYIALSFAEIQDFLAVMQGPFCGNIGLFCRNVRLY